MNVFHVEHRLLAGSDPQAVAFFFPQISGGVRIRPIRKQPASSVPVNAIHPRETDKVKPWRNLLRAINPCADDGVASGCERKPLRTVRQDTALLQRPDSRIVRGLGLIPERVTPA